MEFGKTTEGDTVDLVALTNASGMVVRLMNLGATLVGWDVPDRQGELADVVLGFDDVAGYQSKRNQHFGCTTGRYANRIAKGCFELDGQSYQLAINNGPNHLHGGSERGIDKVVWKTTDISEGNTKGVRFDYTSPDGEEQFPGNLAIAVTFALGDEGDLRIDYRATTDKPTIINLTNHAYFNLAGEGTGSIDGHSLTINADHYTPVDDGLIPTGKIAEVEGTPLDFRSPHLVGERIGQLTGSPANGYDHNFVLNKTKQGELSEAAQLLDPESGRLLRVFTTEPGVQFYSGNSLRGQKGKGGKPYAPRTGCCLETQHFPDSPNQPDFPSVVLRPGEEYRHTCIYKMSVADA